MQSFAVCVFSFFSKKAKSSIIRPSVHFLDSYRSRIIEEIITFSAKISNPFHQNITEKVTWSRIAGLFSLQQQAVCLAAAEQYESSWAQNGTWLPQWRLSRWVEGGKIKDGSPVKAFLFEFQGKRWGGGPPGNPQRHKTHISNALLRNTGSKREWDIDLWTQERIHLLP